MDFWTFVERNGFGLFLFFLFIVLPCLSAIWRTFHIWLLEKEEKEETDED